MIKCKNPHAYGDKCVISMSIKENLGGAFCCDIAEEFGFSGEYILKFCKHAEKVMKQTNADRIRSMTDEELAEYLKKELKPHIMMSAESILRWLQEEV